MTAPYEKTMEKNGEIFHAYILNNKGRKRVIERARKKHPDGWSAQLCYWCGHERMYHLMVSIATWRDVPFLRDVLCLRGAKNNKCGCWRFDTVKEAVAATLAGDTHPHRKVSAGYWREKEAI